MAIRTGRPMWGDHRPADHLLDPPASVIAQRPPLAPSVGTNSRSAHAPGMAYCDFPAKEELDATSAWLTHLAAGRILIE